MAMKQINTLVVNAVSYNNRAIHMDREANIRGCNLNGEDVYRLTQLVRTLPRVLAAPVNLIGPRGAVVWKNKGVKILNKFILRI